VCLALQDAWLEGVKVDPSLAQRAAEEQAAADGVEEEMSTGEMAAIKRRIADTLEGGETVLQGLRRLGGQGGNKQGGRGRGGGPAAVAEKKMSEEEKRRFDALTEDASRLMEAGEYSEWGKRWGRGNRSSRALLLDWLPSPSARRLVGVLLR
jgi:CD2 antigen cytoplasmic tail-binding protein 2